MVNLSMTKLIAGIFNVWSSCVGQTCYLRTREIEKFSYRQDNSHCQAFFQNSFSSLLSILVGDSRDFWIHILKHFHILFCWSIVFLSSWCYDKVVTELYKSFGDGSVNKVAQISVWLLNLVMAPCTPTLLTALLVFYDRLSKSS